MQSHLWATQQVIWEQSTAPEQQRQATQTHRPRGSFSDSILVWWASVLCTPYPALLRGAVDHAVCVTSSLGQRLLPRLCQWSDLQSGEIRRDKDESDDDEDATEP